MQHGLIDAVEHFSQPLMVIVVCRFCPPVQQLVQRDRILRIICTLVLFRVTVRRDFDPIAVGSERQDINAESGSAPMSIQLFILKVPEPLVLHFLWDVAKFQLLHLRLADFRCIVNVVRRVDISEVCQSDCFAAAFFSVLSIITSPSNFFPLQI